MSSNNISTAAEEVFLEVDGLEPHRLSQLGCHAGPLHLSLSRGRLNSLQAAPPGLWGFWLHGVRLDEGLFVAGSPDRPALLHPPAAVWSLSLLSCTGEVAAFMQACMAQLPLRLLRLWGGALRLPALSVSLEEIYLDGDMERLPDLPPGLRVLGVTNCGLQELPALPAGLQKLFAMNNQLQGLPALPAGLRALDVRENPLAGLPPLPASLRELSADLLDRPLPDELQHLRAPIAQLPRRLPRFLTKLSVPVHDATLHFRDLPPLPPYLSEVWPPTARYLTPALRDVQNGRHAAARRATDRSWARAVVHRRLRRAAADIASLVAAFL